jgi:hypothetical protein
MRLNEWLGILRPAMNHAADYQTAQRAHDENRSVRLCDNGARDTEQKPEQDANEPAGPGQLNAPDNRTNGKALNECGA